MQLGLPDCRWSRSSCCFASHLRTRLGPLLPRAPRKRLRRTINRRRRTKQRPTCTPSRPSRCPTSESTAIYNVWTHDYGIQALDHMHGRRPRDSERKRKIEDLIRNQYDYLTRYESVDGGWGYYDFGAQTQRPNASSTSFVNAAVLEA